MSSHHFLLLITLAAIWGSSFMFIRISAQELNAVWLTEGRVALAALFLFAVAIILKKKLDLRQGITPYLVIGLLNCVLPFILIGYAAQGLTASSMSILNATAPTWGAIIAAFWFREGMSFGRILGLLIGFIGVGVLLGLHSTSVTAASLPHAVAQIGGPFFYGLSTTYARSIEKLDSFSISHGSLWAAAALTVPLLLVTPMPHSVSVETSLSLLILGVVCSGVAYLLYFKLVMEAGGSAALSVAYLIPLFGTLWGVVFLDEIIGWHTVLGGCLIVLGTMLTTNTLKLRAI